MTVDYTQMLADRAAGTQGDWRLHADKVGEVIMFAAGVVTYGRNTSEANARRIANIPNMEAEIIRLRKALAEIMLLSDDEVSAGKAAAALKGEAAKVRNGK